MMSQFQIGDRVEAVSRYNHVVPGMTGVVFSVDEGYPPIGVKWDNFAGKGHSGPRNTDATRSSYFVNENDVQIIPKTLENE